MLLLILQTSLSEIFVGYPFKKKKGLRQRIEVNQLSPYLLSKQSYLNIY